MNYIELLQQSEVPQTYWEEIVASMNKSHDLFYPDVLLTKLTAPFAVPFIIPFLRWEDEKLPDWCSRYDNNISINGDSANWTNVTREDGIVYGKRIPQPLDKNITHNAGGDILNYYTKRGHVRDWWARLVWLGYRNPGGGRAFQVGPNVSHLVSKVNDTTLKFDIRRWGPAKPTRKEKSVVVYNIGEHWQIIAHYPWKGKIWIDANLGYKVGNLAADYGPGDPEAQLCVCHTKVPYIQK